MGLFSSDSDSNAITLLKHDHQVVDGLFKEWEKADSAQRKVAIVNQICRELSIHARIEEEIFYPRVAAVLDRKDDALIREAIVEHGSLKGLMSLLDGNNGKDEMFDAYVTVLMEYVKHHVKEEENELFPKVRRTDIDLDALGSALLARKEALLRDAGSEAKTPTTVALPEFARAA